MANGRNLVTARDRARAAKGAGMATDMSEVFANLDKLGEAARVSLARSMAVAGGKVIRDEAKQRVPLRTDVLYGAIYLAYKTKSQGTNQARYSVTWNGRKAPHGHLVEFGYMQIYKVRVDSLGRFWTDKTQRLPVPKYIPGQSFLRSAYEATTASAQAAMMRRGRERWQELISEVAGGGQNGNAQ